MASTRARTDDTEPDTARLGDSVGRSVLADILETAVDGIIVIDEAGTVVVFNWGEADRRRGAFG